MQLQKWTLVNKQFFAPRSGLSQSEWRLLIKQGAINGKIIGENTFIDVDQLASCTVLTAKNTDDIPNLLD